MGVCAVTFAALRGRANPVVILIVLLMTRTLDHILDPVTEFLLKFYLGIL